MEVRILKDLPKPVLKTCVDSKGVRGTKNANLLEVRILKKIERLGVERCDLLLINLVTSPTPQCFVQRVRNCMKVKELTFSLVQKTTKECASC
jgi:hypothetical protein